MKGWVRGMVGGASESVEGMVGGGSENVGGLIGSRGGSERSEV